MILLVPISPEMPRRTSPTWWQSAFMATALVVGFAWAHEALIQDHRYVEGLAEYIQQGEKGETILSPDGQTYLSKRPLLKVAASRGDWDIRRLIAANFIHGSATHLGLNLIGIIAGTRICSAFVPFLCTLAIFLLGGSLGLASSLWGSKEISTFIPHVGASAGIFALMGTYYVYNFRFRTRYFFWFPTRKGALSLKTSTFFFLDVLFLELFLSAAQLFPSRVDSVDHIAHVVGFLSGIFLALFLRLSQRWPQVLQTRDEFLFWADYRKRLPTSISSQPVSFWLRILTLNPINSQAKKALFKAAESDLENEQPIPWFKVFSYLNPTFIRLHAEEAGSMLATFLLHGGEIPPAWLRKTPYDSIIRLAQSLTRQPEYAALIRKLILQYKNASPSGADIDRKLELLAARLSAVLPDGPNSTTNQMSQKTKAGTP